ncbi:MAG TPA: hypothetical protein P5076_20055, partial [Myxococcota bacterium]|nr:hypothetical protein [Myxococcota bacterium]
KALTAALGERGFKLVSYDDYLKRAAKLRFKGGKALTPKGIAAAAKAIPLDGVVTGSALPAKAGAMLVTVVLYDPRGKQVLKKTYKLRQPKLPAENASELADQIQEKLGGKRVALQPAEPVAKVEPAPAAEPKPKPANDAFLPAWARAKPGEEPAAGGARPADEPAPRAAAEPEAGARAEAPAKEGEPREVGSSNEALVTAGASMHFRHGLSPRHEATFYPGFRIDGRLFLGAFVDNEWLGGLGLGGMFDMGLGLEYARSDNDQTFSASQYQWRAELMYRLAFKASVAPALILRFGYGATSNTIEDAGDALATSASYMAPYVGLDFFMFLWKPYLRIFASGVFQFAVQPGEEVAGSGLGFGVYAGFDVNVTDYLTLGLGYDLTQYMMEDGSTGGMGSYSDTFQSAFLRVGYTYY